MHQIIIAASILSFMFMPVSHAGEDVFPNSMEIQLGSQSLTPTAQDYTAWKLSFSFWKSWKDWSVGPQFSYLQIPETGSQATTVQTNSLEGIIWGRYRVDVTSLWNLYAGMGLGMRKDIVNTRIYGTTTDSFGEPYGLSAASIGTQYKFPAVMISFEIQYFYIPSFENKEVAALIGAGVFF